MQAVIRVRAPTYWAWLTSVVGVAATGELFSALREADRLTLFHHVLGRAQLRPVLVALAAGAVLAVGWLVSLYLRPGRLDVDVENERLRRERRSLFGRRVLEAPASEWRVRITYFSGRERAAGSFKRLELDGPGISDVLLLTDVDDSELLVRSLEQLRERLGGFTEQVQKPRP